MHKNAAMALSYVWQQPFENFEKSLYAYAAFFENVRTILLAAVLIALAIALTISWGLNELFFRDIPPFVIGGETDVSQYSVGIPSNF